jgi:hypothetical protein
MKLTAKQVEAKLRQVWGSRVVVVPYRISGNRYVYAARDDRGHWLALDASWVGGRQVFEPSEGSWPEPKQTTWDDAVLAASQLAMAYFVDQGNGAALRRLPRAEVIAEGKNWQHVGDEPDTWLIRSSSKVGIVYEVNGRCACSTAPLDVCVPQVPIRHGSLSCNSSCGAFQW